MCGCYESEIGLKWVLVLRQNYIGLQRKLGLGSFLDISFFLVQLLNLSPNLLYERFVDVALPLCVEVVILSALTFKLPFPLLKLELIQPNLRLQETQVT